MRPAHPTLGTARRSRRAVLLAVLAFAAGVSGGRAERDRAAGGDLGRDGRVTWAELKGYLTREVEEAAHRASGREQVPEVDDAPIVLQASLPVDAVVNGVAALRDEAAWRRAESTGTREGFEASIGTCGEVCAYRPQAMDRLLAGCQRAAAAIDQENWARFGATRQYQACSIPAPRLALIAAWHKAILAAPTRAATRG